MARKDKKVTGTNKVEVGGNVERIIIDSDKVLKFTLKCPIEDSKAVAYLTITCFTQDFDDELENVDVGTEVTIKGHLYTGSYENKKKVKIYTTEVIAESIDV